MAEPDPDPLVGDDINPDDEYFAKQQDPDLVVKDDDDVLFLALKAIEAIDA